MILNDSELELEVSKQHKVKTENPEQIILEDNFKAALTHSMRHYFPCLCCIIFFTVGTMLTS